MPSADEFYVYAYLRKSNNLPYYIGKGQGAMSHVSHGKAKHHKQWTCNFLKENNFGNS